MTKELFFSMIRNIRLCEYDIFIGDFEDDIFDSDLYLKARGYEINFFDNRKKVIIRDKRIFRSEKETLKLVACYRKWAKKNIKNPEDRILFDFDTDVNGKYNYNKHLDSIKKSMTTEESENWQRTPIDEEIENMDLWIKKYESILNEIEKQQFIVKSMNKIEKLAYKQQDFFDL